MTVINITYQDNQTLRKSQPRQACAISAMTALFNLLPLVTILTVTEPEPNILTMVMMFATA